MGRAYSQDLRERVMAAVDSGTGAYAAASSRNLLDRNRRHCRARNWTAAAIRSSRSMSPWKMAPSDARAVLSGASTGAHEAVEMRDSDERRDFGKGVQKTQFGQSAHNAILLNSGFFPAIGKTTGEVLPPGCKLHQEISRSYANKGAACLAACKIFCRNRTKMFHVKHFLNDSNLEMPAQLVGCASCILLPPRIYSGKRIAARFFEMPAGMPGGSKDWRGPLSRHSGSRFVHRADSLDIP